MTVDIFLTKYDNVLYDLKKEVQVDELDLDVLDREMQLSPFLKSRFSLKWLLSNLEVIAGGKYRPFPYYEKANISYSQQFKNARHYTQDELKGYITNIDDVDF